MNVVIHQPQFLPFVGFWHRLLRADILVCSGGFKFSQDGHGHRVTVDGKWMTLPIRGHQRTRPIHEIRLVDPGHAVQMAGNLYWRLKDAPYLHRLAPLHDLLANWATQADPYSLFALQIASLRVLRDILGLSCAIMPDTEIREGFDAPGKLDAILHKVGGTGRVRYLTAGAARDYLRPEMLVRPYAVAYQDYPTPPPRDSIAQLIAREPNPLAAIEACAVWQTFGKDSYEL